MTALAHTKQSNKVAENWPKVEGPGLALGVAEVWASLSGMELVLLFCCMLYFFVVVESTP